MKIIRFLLDRLDERSTWRGLILLLSAFGVSLDPQLSEAIIVFALGMVGLIEALLPEPNGKIHKSKPTESQSTVSRVQPMPSSPDSNEPGSDRESDVDRALHQWSGVD